MDKNEIIKILEDWNFWKKDLDIGIGRSYYLNKLKNLLAANQVIVITGARRSGKSYIMRQLANNLFSGGVNKKDVLIVNFEDPRFTRLDARALQEIYEVYLEFLAPGEKPYLFLDEIQEVAGWERWVRMMHELNKAKIIISGSNAKLLSKELSTLLTGRHIDLTVFPLSLNEYLNFNNIYIKDTLDLINKNIEIKGLLWKYLEFGAFPKVVLAEEKNQILLNYFEDILNKDLIKRFKIRKTEGIKSLAKFYLGNISSLMTFSSIERFLGVSADTIEKYSYYFESAYMFFFLKRFSYKVKEQEKSPRKVYAIDTGLVNTVGFRFSQNTGRLAENLVFLELKKDEIKNPDLGLYYWKDLRHREVDFVIKEGFNVKQLIQVCWDLNRPETKNRELKPLLKAMGEFNLKKGIIITEDYEAVEEVRGDRIEYIPLWKWLMGFSSV